MSIPATDRARRLPLALLAILALLPATAWAQTGRIAGAVADEDGQPVSGAEVLVVGTRFSALTGEAGTFAIDGVPAGTYRVRVAHVAFETVEREGVTVRADGTARLEIALAARPFQLESVVVSASRRAERITDAPATVTRLDAGVIENSIGNSFSGALKEVKGIDYIQVGVTAVAINARGFNSSFNNRMLMMEDGRIAVLPENGLPVGQFTAVPKLDLAGVEVLVGPGAALYGADASNGVLTLQTKDPRQYPGTTVEVAGGSRSYRDIQFRHAGVSGDFGYKVFGEWQAANDFENTLYYRGGTLEETGVGDDPDWTSQVARGGAALVYYRGDGRFEVTGGLSVTDGIGQTNVGRNQLRDWQYNYIQARYSSPNWYFNAYRTQSKSGESYALNRFTENRADNPDLSDEELRLMSDWPSDGQLYAAELQNNFHVPALLNTEIVWGAQYRYDRVSSDEEWLTDAKTGEPLGISQYGVYAQTETPLTPQLSLLLAARYDDHENYDAQFSPKAGLVYKPADGKALRLTYNRAFKSPTTLQTNFWIPQFVSFVGVYGNTEGFTVRDADGNILRTIEPLVPEENQTWELGFKGVLGERVFLDVAGYYARYQDFLGSLKVINNPFPSDANPTPTFAYDAQGNMITGNTALGELPEIVLTYQNLGEATIYGTDAGLTYALSPNVTLKGNVSWVKLSDLEEDPLDPQATALNSTPVKWALGVDFSELVPNLRAGFTARHVTGYRFSSGINDGVIPTFNTLDLSFGYDLPELGAQLIASAHNLFTCRSVYETGDTDTRCGFDEPHLEMVNMPEIGTTLFVGVRYQR